MRAFGPRLPPALCGGFAAAALYPAPGYLIRTTGVLSGLGNWGYSWASTISGTNAYYLEFYYGRIYPSTASSRTYGLQVRCLRE